MTPALSLLTVSYRSEADLSALLESFRREATRLGLRSQVVVVDHSESAGADAPPCGSDRWIAQANRGYAAGVNRAAAEATGDVFLVANLVAGDVDAVINELGESAALVTGEADRGGTRAAGELDAADHVRGIAAG